jgi:hypothetical protein
MGCSEILRWADCRMGDFKKLEVWRRAQKLAETIYQLTNGFPATERYGLSL